MCGFAGVVAWDDRYRVDRETLRKMSARVAHRGPDGEGLHLNHEQEVTPDRPQVGLVHRRLAIIDPDPRGNQPFTDGEGRWLVYNGEIYNFRDLRAELKKLKPEYVWRTDCDTEVLLIAYCVWGEKCVEHLNGMFAFAVWDENAKTLYLARDRMGQKPLYVAYEGDSSPDLYGPEFHSSQLDLPAGVVAFASEPAPLSGLGWVDLEVTSWGLMKYLFWGAASGFQRGVQQLSTGATERIRRGMRHRNHYFKSSALPGLDAVRPTDAAAADTTRALIEHAVKRQLVADVPVGCFLSGGVDSSITALAMRNARGPGQQLHTFSIGFEDPRYDESEYARGIAAHLKSEHHAFVVRPDAANDLPRLARAFGEPFGDSSALPTHYLARETRRHVKVALSGDGGDELFGGYDRYRALVRSVQLSRLPGRLRRPLARAVAGALPGSNPKSPLSRARRFLRSLDVPLTQRYPSYLHIFSRGMVRDLLADEHQWPQWPDCAIEIADGTRHFALLLGQDNDVRSAPHEPVVAALAFDRLFYLPDDLLTKVDRASMLHALEVRSPFMDHELVQFAAGLTTDQLLKGGPKRMLREAFANDLPAWVFKRKKMGFAVPIGEWFRGELRPMLRDHLFAADSFARGHFQMKIVERLVDEHETQRVDHSQRLYALLMLELWWRTQRPA